MRRIRFRSGAAVLALTLSLSSGAQATESAAPVTPYVDADTVLRWKAEGKPVTWVDSRDPDEFAAGHVPGSINIPLSEKDSAVEKLPRTGTIVIYCIHSAHRAPALARILEAQGVKDIRVVEGGLTALREAGATLMATDRAVPEILPATERCKDAAKAAGP